MGEAEAIAAQRLRMIAETKNLMVRGFTRDYYKNIQASVPKRPVMAPRQEGDIGEG